MKTKLFLLGLCALALASCSIDETTKVNDTNAISFKATATRATAATTNSIDAFTVWAWETIEGTTGSTTTKFMDGVQAARASEGSSTFTTKHTYYWPGAPIDFYAFIPAANDGVEVENYDACFGGKITPTAEVVEGTTEYTYDGYVANATIDDPSKISFDVHVPTAAADEIDLGYAATLGQSSGTVGLNFRHAFSQVAFKAQNTNEDWTVKIKGVTLCGLYKEGAYTLPEFGTDGTTVHNATDAKTGEWTIEEGAVKGRFEAGISETTFAAGESGDSQSITAENGALMLIPQKVAAWDPDNDKTNEALGAYIRINCQVTDSTEGRIWPNYHELDSTGALLDYADITIPFDVAWEEGSLYTYTIVFGEGLGYYAPDDEDTDLDGTPVLIPIRFTIDIDDFGNVDETKDTDVDLTSITVHSAKDLQAAVKAGYSEITVSVIEEEEPLDLTLTSYLEFNGDCTLNIGEGVTITGADATGGDNAIDHNGDGGAGGYSAVIYVNGGNLTINSEGTVQTAGVQSSCLTNAIWVVNGKVTVNGGTFKGSNYSYTPTTTSWSKHAVYCGENGYAYLKGGSYSCGYTYVTYDETENGYWVLNCHNSSEESGHAMIYCTGGKYLNFDPSNPGTDDATSYVAEGYTVTSEESGSDVWYTVVESN